MIQSATRNTLMIKETVIQILKSAFIQTNISIELYNHNM